MRLAKVLAVMVGAGLTLTGCATVDQTTRGGMMGGPPSSRPGMMGGFGAAMMGSDQHGYRLAPLSCSAPSSLPGTTVYVTLGDMGMTTRMMRGEAPLGQHMMLRGVAQVPAGRVSFVVGNMGWRIHELVVLPLESGQAAGQRTAGPDGKVDETGSLGEASASCASGSGEGIESGTVSWVTLTLPAGRYEMACNLPNHYADGMYQELTVTG